MLKAIAYGCISTGQHDIAFWSDDTYPIIFQGLDNGGGAVPWLQNYATTSG